MSLVMYWMMVNLKILIYMDLYKIVFFFFIKKIRIFGFVKILMVV